MKKFIAFITAVILIPLCALAQIPVHQCDVPIYNESAGHNWSDIIAAPELRRWAISQGLYARDDRQPRVDSQAVFVKTNGSSVIIDGFEQFRHYRLFIDFVQYRGNPDQRFTSHLKIYVDGKLFDEVEFSQLFGDTYYNRQLPLEFTNKGRITVTFYEFGNMPGVWGIWDIIATTADFPVISQSVQESEQQKLPDNDIRNQENADKKDGGEIRDPLQEKSPAEPVKPGNAGQNQVIPQRQTVPATGKTDVPGTSVPVVPEKNANPENIEPPVLPGINDTIIED